MLWNTLLRTANTNKPIRLVGFAGTTVGVTSGTTVRVPMPSGVQRGDILIAVLATGFGSTSAVWSNIAGWTRIRSQSAAGPLLAVYTRVADGSEPFSYAFSVTGGSFTSVESGDGAIIAFRNTSIDVVGALGTRTTASTITAPSIDMVRSGWAVRIFAKVTLGTTSLSTSGTTIVSFANGTSGAQILVAYAEVDVGATGAVTASTQSSSYGGIGMLLGLSK